VDITSFWKWQAIEYQNGLAGWLAGYVGYPFLGVFGTDVFLIFPSTI